MAGKGAALGVAGKGAPGEPELAPSALGEVVERGEASSAAREFAVRGERAAPAAASRAPAEGGIPGRLRRLGEMVLLGLVLFAAGRALEAARPLPLEVRVPAGASAEERARRSEEAVLLAEAHRLDLVRHDALVLHRVAANLAVAGEVDEDPEALLAKARELGMLERDPLIRAHLLRRMRARGDVGEERYAVSVVEEAP